ncbi:MAG: hypothetical protein WD572_06855 [Gammaproteobacteria bacterium]
MKLTLRLFTYALLPALLSPVLFASASDADETASSYLKIDKEFSGKCQGLRRGDMRVLINTHVDKIIEYRMIRLLADKRQAGLNRDRIGPGEDNTQKLGCETIDGMEQTWEITSAHFVEDK